MPGIKKWALCTHFLLNKSTRRWYIFFYMKVTWFNSVKITLDKLWGISVLNANCFLNNSSLLIFCSKVYQIWKIWMNFTFSPKIGCMFKFLKDLDKKKRNQNFGFSRICQFLVTLMNMSTIPHDQVHINTCIIYSMT